MQTMCQLVAIEVSYEGSLRAICCGRYYLLKSDAYVSASRVMSQTKIIAHFFCKASVAIGIL